MDIEATRKQMISICTRVINGLSAEEVQAVGSDQSYFEKKMQAIFSRSVSAGQTNDPDELRRILNGSGHTSARR